MHSITLDMVQYLYYFHLKIKSDNIVPDAYNILVK